MCHETGFLKFGGVASISQFNFAGLGTTGPGVPGFNFAATYGDNAWGITTGVRGHVQHLKCYASTAPLNPNTLRSDGQPYDPRWSNSLRGTATPVEALGGKWATNPSYAVSLINYMQLIWAASPQAIDDPATMSPSASGSISPSPSPSGSPSQTPGESGKPSQTPGESERPSQTPGESESPSQTPGAGESPSQTPDDNGQATPAGDIPQA
jgi:hypothetical protein